MTMQMTTGAILVALTMLAVAPAAASDDALMKDLTAVIALNSQPCGQVVGVQRLGDNDYAASCSDGNRYRVVLRDGRVVVQKQ